MSDQIFTEVMEGEDDYIGGRYPIPEGWATPTELTHILRAKKIITNMAPQQIYTGFIKKQNSGFPYRQHIDGRIICPIDDSIIWIVRWLQEKAEKEARKASIAIKRAEAAASAIDKKSEIEESIEESIEEIEEESEWARWGDLGE